MGARSGENRNDMGAQAALIRAVISIRGESRRYPLRWERARVPRLSCPDDKYPRHWLSPSQRRSPHQLANGGVAARPPCDAPIDYVHNAIATAPGLGSGHGPLNHLAEYT